nr:DNA internalization-related competence protein ComEC/Rec2 [Ligilactobacillus ceti]
MSHQRQVHLIENKQPQMLQLCLKVQPDQVKINGNSVYFSGVDQFRRKLNCTWYPKKTNDIKVLKLQESCYLQVSGQLQPFIGATNENQFDARRYYYGKRVFYKLKIEKIISIKPVRKNIVNQLHTLRWQIIQKLKRYPEPYASYAQALLVGYQSEVFQGLTNVYSKLGIIYLFCLSGMHVFYVIWIIKTILTYLHVTQETQLTILLIVLPLYLILAGGSASLVRAIGMAWLLILGQKIKVIKLTKLTTWSCLLAVNLFLAPESIFSLGVQLSYLLTLGLILLQEANYFKLNLKINALTLPLILWHTYQYNLLTPLLTWVITPIFAVVFIPLLLLGLGPEWMLMMSNQVLQILTLILVKIGQLPTEITYGKPSLLVVLMIVISVFYAQKLTKPQKLITCLSILIVGNFIVIKYPIAPEIVYFDIGQGDSTLIRERFNRSVTLVDTGGKLNFSAMKQRNPKKRKTNGEKIIVNYLKSKGLMHLDHLVLTHQDTDHIGDFPAISRHIKIAKIYVPAGMEKQSAFLRRLDQSENTLADVYPVLKGMNWGVSQTEILYPIQVGAGKNEDSITFIKQFAGLQCFFSGDLNQAGELKILKEHPNLKIDILKTGHHGSQTSTHPQLLQSTKPCVALISCGRKNRYGHPAQITLENLEKYQIPYYLTAHDGMMKVKKVGRHVELQLYQMGKWRKIRIK